MTAFLTRALAIVTALVFLSGCAQGARTTAMVAPLDSARIIQPGSPLSGALKVGSVTGGTDTSALLASQISSDAFRQALEQSLSLNTMIGGNDAPMTVDATIQAVEQPFGGISMTVTTTVAYKVLSASGTPVFSETITTPYTAAFSDAFVGAERLRLANEGSAKANIAKFIEELNDAATTNPAAFAAGAV
jgi:hypothetical protein